MSPCEKLIDLLHAEWGGAASSGIAARASAGLEAGQVLFLPELSFARQPGEAVLFDPATGRLGGTNASGGDAELLRALMRRFSDAAAALVNTLLPDYRATIARGRASFRPAEIAGRASSWRKD